MMHPIDIQDANACPDICQSHSQQLPTYETFGAPPSDDSNGGGNGDAPANRFAKICHSIGTVCSKASVKVCTSYTLSSWGDRMWTFSLSLALTELGGNLRLPAISGFAISVAALLLAGLVGKLIDRSPRLLAARVALVANNALVATSALLLVISLILKPAPGTVGDSRYDNATAAEAGGGNASLSGSGAASAATAMRSSSSIGYGTFASGSEEAFYWLCIVLAIVTCSAANLASIGSKVVVSKDWAVVIANGDHSALASLNSWLVRLDQTCMILAPVLAGLVMAALGTQAGCILIAVWNVLSLGVEYALLSVVYTSTPQLAIKHELHDGNGAKACSDAEEKAKAADEGADVVVVPETEAETSNKAASRNESALGAWHVYLLQESFWAAIALAALYLTVLGLDGITTGFAYAQGLGADIVAASRGIGAVFGIAGSVAYPHMRKAFGTRPTGATALAFQFVVDLLALASVWLAGSPYNVVAYFTTGAVYVPSADHSQLSIWVFIAGITIARFGLWMADLCITQIMQEAAGSSVRGRVFAVQSALQNAANLVKDVLVIALPDPSTFGLLIMVSCGAVLAANVSFAAYCVQMKGTRRGNKRTAAA